MRRVKHILSYVLVLSMCFTLFFFPNYKIYAENATYISIGDGNYCLKAHTSNGSVEGYKYSLSINSSNSDVRLIGIKNLNNNYFYLYGISESTFRYNFNFENSWTDGACSYPSGGYNASLSNGYYYFSISDNNRNINYADFPFITTSSNGSMLSLAIDYTFGGSAVDPTPPGPNYGKPYDVEYSTRIAGSGLASADNIDRIVWNRAVDTNGNELPTGARVQIRAIPGKYVGNTANDVLTKTYTDFILDHSKQLIIVDIIASRGVYETKWSEVVDHFGFFPYSWVPNIQYIDNEYFKMGWIYQIRLQVDDYYSDWTNIYTATGSGASESQTITDSDEISQQLVQDINIVNQLNNTTTTNWYINETTINNSEYTENTNGKPWWAYLLEAILSLFQIDDGNQQTINNTNNLNIDLNDKLNEYNEIEDQQLNNLDTNLEAIEVESDMLENNKFVGSANWVAQQYTRMTNGTVIGSLIGFSLLFGLALIFIGKIR